jgi:hypothetical protein
MYHSNLNYLKSQMYRSNLNYLKSQMYRSNLNYLKNLMFLKNQMTLMFHYFRLYLSCLMYR